MKQALFVSQNMLGDGLYTGPVLREWFRRNPDYCGVVHAKPGFGFDMYRRLGLPLEVIASTRLEPDFDSEFVFDCDKAFQLAIKNAYHLVDAFAEMSGLGKLNDRRPIYLPEQNQKDIDWLGTLPDNLILVCPESSSCTSYTGGWPNKMMSLDMWGRVMPFLKERGCVKILGSSSFKLGTERYDSHLTGVSLNRTALLMASKKTKLVVSVDNGMSHLAASQNCPTFLLSGACLPATYIEPINLNLLRMWVDPVEVDIDTVMSVVKKYVPTMLQLVPYRNRWQGAGSEYALYLKSCIKTLDGKDVHGFVWRDSYVGSLAQVQALSNGRKTKSAQTKIIIDVATGIPYQEANSSEESHA